VDLALSTGGAHNVEIINETYSRRRYAQLLAESDVYVSLHRAEGLGLPILEALSFGLPAIVTNWGGPSELVNSSCGRLVPCEGVRVGREAAGAIRPAMTWANPDIAAAAECLRELAEPEVRRELSRGALQQARKLAGDQTARELKYRLGAIYQQLAQSGSGNRWLRSRPPTETLCRS